MNDPVGYLKSLIWLPVVSVLFAETTGRSLADTPFVQKTYTYKVVCDCKVEADVYRADDKVVRSGVVWIHGGALIVGSRRSIPQDLLGLCRDEGFVLVSIDYRLAPEVKLPSVIQDVQDAFRWIRGEGSKLFHVDPDRLVVTGGSAGGYLAMMTGICIKPPPQALVAYWGYGDVDGAWFTRPSRYYRQTIPRISEEEARRGVGSIVLTGTDGNTPQQEGRIRYYHWLRQNGLWTKELTGFDPDTEKQRLDPYCPVRNITGDYPAILMIHGTRDNDVPHEQSAAMAQEQARQHVRHELISVPGAGHGLRGGDQKLVGEARARALAFIRQHLN